MIPSTRLVAAGSLVPLLWLVLYRATPRSDAWAEAILLTGPWVLVPLGARLCGIAFGVTISRVWAGGSAAAAVLVTGAFALRPGPLAGAMALPWLAATMAAAARLFPLARRGPAGRCAWAAWIFLVVGAAWTMADRLGLAPLRFDPVVVRLTAIHFHHAGFSAPLLAALASDRRPGPLAGWTCALMIAGAPLTAVGITSTHLGGPPWVETAAATMMVAAAAGVVALQAALAWRGPFRGPSRGLLAFSTLCLAAGSVLALSYAWRFWAPPLLGDIPAMRAVHGTLNGFGFGLCGLMAWPAAIGRGARKEMVPEEGIEPTRV